MANLSYTESLSHQGLQRLEFRSLYINLLLLFKLKFNLLHLFLDDFCKYVSSLHDNRFISLHSRSQSSYYSFSTYSVHKWKSTTNHVTNAQNFCHFRCLLSNLNLLPYLQGRF